jgi:hypothetical protein
MKQYLYFILVACTVSCQTPGSKKSASNWYPLSQSEQVNCSLWPLRDGELQIDEINVVKGSLGGFFVSGLKRNGGRFHYYSPMNSDSPAIENFTTLSLGGAATVLGGTHYGSSLYAVVARNEENNVTIELRTVPGNILLFSKYTGIKPVVDGEAILARNGIWLSYKTDDNLYHLIFFNIREAKKITAHPATNLTLTNPPTVIPSGAESSALIVWHEDERDRPFKTQVIREDGTSDAATDLNGRYSQVESWTAQALNRHLYLATIEGDTMIGQADLKVTEFNLTQAGFKPEPSDSYALTDIHTTEPAFFHGRNGLEVLLLNWIDEESTIARYHVNSSRPSKPTYSGIFQKGTRIIGTSQAPAHDAEYLVTRHREGTRWAFQLCRL